MAVDALGLCISEMVKGRGNGIMALGISFSQVLQEALLQKLPK